MKLLRYGEKNQEKPGLLDENGQIRDLSGVISDIDPSTVQHLSRLQSLDCNALEIVEGTPRIGSCVTRPGKIIGIGLNYADHAKETNMKIPKEPIVFLKATSSLCGPNDNVEIPRDSVKTDWEVELGVVISKKAKYVAETDAMKYVAGYCLINDVSEREFQIERGGQWVKGKSHDTFAPVGPYLVTPEGIGEVDNLSMWLEVDGKKFQDGNTKTMIFKIPKIISYLSGFMTLHPGDIITTGTPPGVGMGKNPQIFLKPGQTIRLGIDGLGEQTQKTVRA